MGVEEINGKTVAVHEVKIDLLIQEQKELTTLLREWIGAGGICEKARRNVDSTTNQLKVIWTILGLTIPPTLGILIKLAFF